MKSMPQSDCEYRSEMESKRGLSEPYFATSRQIKVPAALRQ